LHVTENLQSDKTDTPGATDFPLPDGTQNILFK